MIGPVLPFQTIQSIFKISLSIGRYVALKVVFSSFFTETVQRIKKYRPEFRTQMQKMHAGHDFRDRYANGKFKTKFAKAGYELWQTKCTVGIVGVGSVTYKILQKVGMAQACH